MIMTHYVVVYDITQDKLRTKVSDILKDYGMDRIQYSAFYGELRIHGLNSLKTDLQQIINKGDETDSILIFPLCESCFRNRHELGCEKELTESEEKVVIF